MSNHPIILGGAQTDFARNWTKEGIVVKDQDAVQASAANLYYARVIAPYVEERVYLPPPPFEFTPPPPSPPISPPPPPLEVQYVRGDLDPALVVAPIVAAMAVCAYLMHVYTKRRRDMQNIHVDLDDEIEYDPDEDSEYDSDEDSDEDSDDEYDDDGPQVDVVGGRGGYNPEDSAEQDSERPERRGILGRIFRRGESRQDDYETRSKDPPVAYRDGAGPSRLEQPLMDDDGGGGREDDDGVRL